MKECGYVIKAAQGGRWTGCLAFLLHDCSFDTGKQRKYPFKEDFFPHFFYFLRFFSLINVQL